MAIRFGCPHCDALAHVAQEHAGRIASCARCGNMMTVPYETSSQPAPFLADDEIYFIGDDQAKRWVRRVLFYLACALGVGMLVALCLPAREAAREASRRMSCCNNLKQIALAMHNYHDVHGCLPPAYTTDENGRPMHSWRVLLLPYLESQYIYDQYDFEQPWDSPRNLEVTRSMPSTYQCPSAPLNNGLTNYVVVIGDPEREVPQTMFAPDRSLSFEDVTDGMSTTILMVEVQAGVPWTKPDADLQYHHLWLRVNGSPTTISSNHPHMAHAALADGRVVALEDGMLDSALRCLIGPADGNPVEDFD